MFPREKHTKSSQYFNNQNSSKSIVSSGKYFSKPFYKNQKQTSKKYKCDRLWKKNSSYHWSEKENDKNNSNFPHNKKFHFEGRKTFHYHKKISKLFYLQHSYILKLFQLFSNDNDKENGI